MITGLICTIALQATLTVAQDPKAKPKYPEAGSNIPGTFSAWTVTGKHANTFHGHVSEHGLNPVAMILVNGTKENSKLIPFLKDLDTRIIFNPDTRLASFVIFYDATFNDLIKDDEAKDALSVNIGDFNTEASPKQIAMGLAPKAKIEEYLKDKDAEVTVILYNKLQTISVHSFAEKAKFDGAEIIKEIEAKIGASRTE